MPVSKSGDPTPSGKSKWQYFEQMYFLKYFIVPSQTEKNLPMLNENSTKTEQCESDDTNKQAKYDMFLQGLYSSGSSHTSSKSGLTSYYRHKRNKTDLQE